MEPDPEQSSEFKPDNTGELGIADSGSETFAVPVRVVAPAKVEPVSSDDKINPSSVTAAIPSTEPVSFLVPAEEPIDHRPDPKTYHGPGAAAAGSAGPNKPATLDAPFNGALQPSDNSAVNQGSLLDDVSTSTPDDPLPEPPKPISRPRLIGMGLLTFGILAAIILGIKVELNKSHTQEARLASPSAQIKPQQLPTTSISKQLGTAQTANAVTVNGQLQVTSSLVLQPSTLTSPAVTGQMYFDSATNSLAYYNGKEYVSLQGGGNTYITNNAGNTTNITNNTFVTNVSGGGFGGTGTPGTLAMFNSATTLGDSMITESGTTLNVGTGMGASTANMQGGTGGVSISTAAVSSGVSGDISVMSGNSSASSAGSVTIDTGTGVITGTTIVNDTFENGVDGFTGAPYGTVVAQSSNMAHGGTHSLVVPLSNVSWSSADAGGITVTPGHEYRWTAWVRAGTASAPVVTSVYYRTVGVTSPAVTTNDSTGSWTQITTTFVNPSGNTQLDLAFVYQKNAVEMHYIDDVTLTDLNTFTGLTVNVGATNAQAVNVGNSNQAGDTTITGGTTGIKIKDTTGDVSISSGANTNLSGEKISISSLDTVSIVSGTGDATISTSAEVGSSGNISITTGDSSTTSAGNVTVDTGVNAVTGTVVLNHTFESSTEGIGDGFGFLDSYSTSTAQAHSGTHSLAVTSGNGQYGGGSNPSWHAVDAVPFTTPVVPGDNYEFSAWVRANTNARTVDCEVY